MKPTIGWRKAIAAVFLGVVLVVGTYVAAHATPPTDEHKVTICHRTHSDTNPYVIVTADIASEGHGKGVGDHYAEHQGPVWELGLKEQHIEWGDIIPPYEYEDFSFPGYNWDEAGQAIYENDCEVEQSSPTPTPTDSPTPTETPSPSPTDTPKPSTHTPPPSSHPSKPSSTKADVPSKTPRKTAFTGFSGRAAAAAAALAAIGTGCLYWARRKSNEEVI